MKILNEVELRNEGGSQRRILPGAIRVFVALFAIYFTIATVGLYMTRPESIGWFSSLLSVIYVLALWISVFDFFRWVSRRIVIAVLLIFVCLNLYRLFGTIMLERFAETVPATLIVFSLNMVATVGAIALCAGGFSALRNQVAR